MIKTNGPIAQLGGITGPILYPCRIELRKIVNMVQHGIRVVEVNPKNHSQTVLLTIQNVTKDNFPDPPKYVMPTSAKKVESQTVKDFEVVKASQSNLATETKVDPKDATVNTMVNNILSSTTTTESATNETDGTQKTESTDNNTSKKWYKNKDKEIKSDFDKK